MTARTGDVIEQAARALFLEQYPDAAGAWDAPGEFGKDRWRRKAVALADAGLLRQEPPTREEIARAIYDALSGQYGDFNTPTDAADAVLALLGGGKR